MQEYKIKVYYHYVDGIAKNATCTIIHRMLSDSRNNAIIMAIKMTNQGRPDRIIDKVEVIN